MRPKGQELFFSKRVGKAITDYGMLSEGDRIAVAVSGGKDSLSLLHILRRRQEFCPVKYHLVAVHIDLGKDAKNTKRLRDYFKRCGHEYVIKKLKLASKDSKRKNAKLCFWCSWNRRKLLFETAAEYRCNKVALGHNMDDIIQTILLNLFFNGEISAMSPKQELFAGKLTVIRPLAYLQEDRIRRFAQVNRLPFEKDSCVHSRFSNRRKMAQIIKGLQRICPSVKTNIYRSITRIKKDYLL